MLWRQALVREVQRKFNEKVSKLALSKLDDIDRIEAKNSRIREIIAELRVCCRILSQSAHDAWLPVCLAVYDV